MGFLILVLLVIFSPVIAMIALIIWGCSSKSNGNSRTYSPGGRFSSGFENGFDDDNRNSFEDKTSARLNGYDSTDDYYNRLDQEPWNVDPQVLEEEDPETFHELYGDNY